MLFFPQMFPYPLWVVAICFFLCLKCLLAVGLSMPVYKHFPQMQRTAQPLECLISYISVCKWSRVDVNIANYFTVQAVVHFLYKKKCLVPVLFLLWFNYKAEYWHHLHGGVWEICFHILSPAFSAGKILLRLLHCLHFGTFWSSDQVSLPAYSDLITYILLVRLLASLVWVCKYVSKVCKALLIFGPSISPPCSATCWFIDTQRTVPLSWVTSAHPISYYQ